MLKSGCVGVREIDGLTIVFYDSRTVYVKTTFGAWVVFHRWFHIKRGFCTNNFKPFVKKLRHNRHLTYSFIVEKAQQFDISINASRKPNLEGLKVIYLPTKGRNRNKL